MCVKTACIEESRILLQTQINSRKLSTVLVLEAWVLVLVLEGLGTCYISATLWNIICHSVVGDHSLSVMYHVWRHLLFLINALLNDCPYPVVYRTEVWSIGRPHVWFKVQSLVSQQLGALLCTRSALETNSRQRLDRMMYGSNCLSSKTSQ